MREFRDKSGAAWPIDLTIGDVLRVKAASEGRFNLLDPDSQPGGECGERPLSSIVHCEETSDYAALWELLYLLLEPLARERNLDAVAFAKAMPPECLVSAQQQLMQEWADFFHRLQRPDKATPLEKLALYQAKALHKVKAKLAEPAMREFDAKVDAAIDARLNDSFGSLLATLDATLGRSPLPSSGR